ncbi:MAG: hypothetical protein QOK40_3202 [Miltoncostaeaceae bacterium]|nr:hypothetical protein [Miltoncostaeaceae bacterium]
MTTTRALGDDAQAIALICSGLGSGSELQPLSPTEWTALRDAIHHSPLGRPGALLGLSQARIDSELAVGSDMARRLAGLLDRGGQLALELERLGGRGISLVTGADEAYPKRLRRILGPTAPPLLFVSGRDELLTAHGVAVVGSRDATDAAISEAVAIGRRCAADGLTVVSGAARGIDTAAMTAATEAGGTAVGIVSDALDRMVRRRELRDDLLAGALVLASSHHPESRFTVSRAMARNRIVYALAEAAIVVTSGTEGGTWQGAVENLRAAWTPLHVMADDPPPGNLELIERGGTPLRREQLAGPEPLAVILARGPRGLGQLTLLEDGPPGETSAAEPVPPHSGPPVSGGPEDLFPVVWPHLRAFLSAPRREGELASAFHLQPAQARAWLARAIEAGEVEHVGRPKRYRLRTSREGAAADRV